MLRERETVMFTSHCLSYLGGVALCKLQSNTLCFSSSLISALLSKQEECLVFVYHMHWEASWGRACRLTPDLGIEENAQSAVLNNVGQQKELFSTKQMLHGCISQYCTLKFSWCMLHQTGTVMC